MKLPLGTRKLGEGAHGMTRHEVITKPHEVIRVVVLIAAVALLPAVNLAPAKAAHERHVCNGSRNDGVYTCTSSTPASGAPLRYVFRSTLGAWEFYAMRGQTKVVLASGPQGSGGGTGVVTPQPGDIMEGTIYAPDPCLAPGVHPTACAAHGTMHWNDLPTDDGTIVQSVSTCDFSATASFDPPLMLASIGAHDLGLEGSLNACERVVGATGSAGATVRVGGIVTTLAHPDDQAQYGVTQYEWQEPIAQLSGSCLNVQATGVSFTLWDDFGLTITEFEVRSAYAGLSITGRVLDTYDLEAVNVVSHRQPPTLTLTTTRDRGGLVTGSMVVTSAGNPTCTGEGLSSAGWSTASTLQTIVP